MSTRKTRIIYGDRARVRQITISSVVYSPCSCRSIKRFACGAMASSSFAYSCNWCSFCCTSTEVLVKHVFESHSADPLFTFPCPLAYGRCPHIFKLGSTYFLFNRMQKGSITTGKTNYCLAFHYKPRIWGPGNVARIQPQCEYERTECDECDTGGEPFLPHIQEPTGPSPVSQSAAQFLLTIKEKYRLTQAAVDYAVGSVNQMVSHVCEELHVSVVRTLQNNNIPIPEELNDTFTLIDPFQGLATEYQQSKYYQEHFGLVVSY